MKIRLFSLTLICLIFISIPVQTTTVCSQKFELYGKTTGQNGIIYIVESIFDECEDSYLISIFLSHNKAYISSVSIGFKGYYDFATPIMEELSFETKLVGELENGNISFGDSIIIAPPVTDSTFEDRHMKMIKGGKRGTAENWNNEYKNDQLDLPVFTGIEPKFLLKYDRGLYKNYRLKEAFLFPESGYLVIMTEQRKYAGRSNGVGLESMHGFLVFKIE